MLRPLSPIAKMPGGASQKTLIILWWAEQGSNLRPRPCKGYSVLCAGAGLAVRFHSSFPLIASAAARSV
jgi:hypothetical protein